MTSRFFTPPKLRPLGLELRTLDGGGSCPSQFYGETLDGREVYCRYRGGRLTVEVDQEPGGAVSKEADVLLDAVIGPPLDGDISAQNLCQIAGISVRMPLSDHGSAERQLDLSGAVTYWRDWIPATRPRVIELIEACRSEFAGVELRERWRGPKGLIERVLPAGQEPDRANCVLRFSCGAEATLGYRLLEYDFPGYGGIDDTERMNRLTGKPWVQAGQRGSGLLFENLALGADFATENGVQRGTILALDELISRVFPVVTYEAIDLLSGTVDPDGKWLSREDPAISEWINEADNRLRWFRGEVLKHGAGVRRFVGYRPSREDLSG